MAVKSSGTEQPIRPDELYTLDSFMRYVGLGRSAIRQARAKGLVVRYVAARAFILGADWIDYVTTNGKASKDA